MKIVLISDIHANIYYFSRVLEKVIGEKADRIICLGDLIGYYDEPNKVIELCKFHEIECIKGNHEKYLLNEHKYNISREKLYRIKQHKQALTPENSKFLKDLPEDIVVQYKNILLYCTHAIPKDTTEYSYSPNELSRKYTKNYHYYCSGHTHIPYIQYSYGACIVNPGSIGQPRDYSTKPSYVVIDLKNDTVSLLKVKVDIKPYLEYLKTQGFDDALINILQRKKS